MKISRIIITALFAFFSVSSFSQPELKEDFERGVKLLQGQEYKKAANKFSDVLRKAESVQLKKFCHIYRAFSYNGLDDFKNGISDLDTAIDLDPADLASYTDRGKTKAFIKDLDGAKEDFLHILEIDSVGPQGQAALFYLAKIKYQEGKYQESVNYYDKLLMIKPKDDEAYFNRGAAKDMMMDPAGSIKDYDKAIELNPNYMEAYANRGVAKINLLTTKGTIQPTKEQTSDACADLKHAKQMGDSTVDDMIFAYCDKK